MNRVWGLRLAFIGIALILVTVLLRDVIAEAVFPHFTVMTRTHWAINGFLYDGWAVLTGALIALFGLYRFLKPGE